MLIATRILPVAAAAVLLTGCDEWGEWGGNSDRFREDFRQTQALKSGGRLSIENMNGSIEITGWDRDEVEITGTKYASTEQALKAIRIDVAGSGDSVRIRTVPPSGHRGGMGARYVIHVPRRTELERIVSSNGGIQIIDVEGAARLRTSNGSVKATKTNGAYEIETSNASVDLDGHNGPASVRTSNGQVRAENVRGHLDAVTSNASITARLTDPEPGRPLKLSSSNGSITLTLENLKNNDIVATTSNSSITVRMPGSLGAQLKARTSNSSVSSDFEVAVRGTISKNQLEGAINGGGPVLDLTTSNGAIRVQRL
jgi:DUF4097 and DUF4098 domain-containing protein YvlB